MYQAFVEKCGVVPFNSFICQDRLNLLLFSQLCFSHYSEMFKDHTLGIQSIFHQTNSYIDTTIKKKWDQLAKKATQPPFIRKDGLIGQITIGNKQQPLCIPRSLAITILGHTNKCPHGAMCLVEEVEHHNLPLGIVVNRCIAIPKSRAVPIILVNTSKFNEWVRQPLLAAELYGMDYKQIKKIWQQWIGKGVKLKSGSNMYFPNQLASILMRWRLVLN